VAGTHSGAGKTTVATGLMAALSRRGTKVAGAKVGPDFIDPGYHSAACGRPGRNLDPWICGPDAIGPLAARAANEADVLVVEGVMGLFDGAAIRRDGCQHGRGGGASPGPGGAGRRRLGA
jgi:cobyrinic acid a,c-diamide synthase